MLIFREGVGSILTGYNKNYAENSDLFPITWSIKRAMEYLAPLLVARPQPLIIMECGCAQGNTISYLASLLEKEGLIVGRDFRIIGCDYSFVAIDQCVAKYPKMDFVNSMLSTFAESSVGAEYYGAVDLFIDIGGITSPGSAEECATIYNQVRRFLKRDGMYFFQVNKGFYHDKWMPSRNAELWPKDALGVRVDVLGPPEDLGPKLEIEHEYVLLNTLKGGACAVPPGLPQAGATGTDSSDGTELAFANLPYAQPRYSSADFDQKVWPIISAAAVHGTLADQYYSGPLSNGAKAVSIRHDVDECLRSATDMARFEAERGIRSTYFMLHTADYFWDKSGKLSSQMRSVCRFILDLGHEIGLHNDALTVALLTGRPPQDVLAEALEALRSTGASVIGSAAHGSALAREVRFSNYEIFAGVTAKPFGDRKVVTYVNPQSGRKSEIELGNVDMVSLDLLYEAYFLPRIGQLSDTGGNLRHADEQLYGRYEASGGVYQVLLHPEYWRFT